MKARLKFSKIGSMRFIGHLDVMRYFQKAFRRAGIPVQYSTGFSPHQLMSFASPLGIGLSSEGEYLDLVLEERMEREEFLSKINAQMNEEIAVTDFLYLFEACKSSMAVLAACDYLVFLKPMRTSFLSDAEKRAQARKRFVGREKIELLKKTKRSEKIVDIREYIYQAAEPEHFLQAEKAGDTAPVLPSKTYEQTELLIREGYLPLLFLQLTAGSVVNIKPELVLEALHTQEQEAYDPFSYQIHRLEMYADASMKKGEVHTLSSTPPCELVPLDQYGKDEESFAWNKNF